MIAARANAPPSTRRGLLENTALIVASRLITASSALALIPFVIKTLGIGGYGTWEAMVAIASLSLMFQGAISATAIWQASTAFGAGKLEHVHRAARIGISATLLVFTVVVPLAWLWRARIVGFLNVDEPLRGAASIILPALIAIMILGGLTESLGAIITAHQKTGLTNVANAGALLVNYGSVIASLLLGFGLWSLLIGFVLNFAVNVVVLYWIAFKTAGPFRALPIVPTRDEFRAIGSYYGLVLIGYVSASLRDQTDKIVLSSMASPLSVGYYSIASRLAGLVIEVNRFFYLPTLAATASLNAAGDWPAVRKLFSMMMTIGALVSGSVVVVVASQYDRLIVLWMGKTIHEVVPFLLLLLAGNTFAVILTGVGTSLCRAVDRVGIETTYVTVNLVINIFLTISLVLLIGPIGTVISSAVSWGGSAVVFIVVLHRQLDLPTEGTLKAVRVMGAVALTALIMRGLARALPLSETRAASLVSLSWLVPLTLAIYFALCLSMKIVSRAQIEIVLGEWRDAIMGRAPHRNNARVS